MRSTCAQGACFPERARQPWSCAVSRTRSVKGWRILAVVHAVAEASSDSWGAASVAGLVERASRAAMEAAGVEPEAVHHLEAQASGVVPLEDEELWGLGAAYAARRSGPASVSSASANVGFQAAASGLVSLVRAVESVRQGQRLPVSESLEPRLSEPRRSAGGGEGGDASRAGTGGRQLARLRRSRLPRPGGPSGGGAPPASLRAKARSAEAGDRRRRCGRAGSRGRDHALAQRAGQGGRHPRSAALALRARALPRLALAAFGGDAPARGRGGASPRGAAALAPAAHGPRAHGSRRPPVAAGGRRGPALRGLRGRSLGQAPRTGRLRAASPPGARAGRRAAHRLCALPARGPASPAFRGPPGTAPLAGARRHARGLPRRVHLPRRRLARVVLGPGVRGPARCAARLLRRRALRGRRLRELPGGPAGRVAGAALGRGGRRRRRWRGVQSRSRILRRALGARRIERARQLPVRRSRRRLHPRRGLGGHGPQEAGGCRGRARSHPRGGRGHRGLQ